MRRFLFALVQGVFASILFVGPSGALLAQTPPEVSRGLQWLSNQIQADGTLAGEPQSIATPLQCRSETAQALQQLAALPPNLVDAIAAATESNTEYAARQIIALALDGRAVSAQLAGLVARQNDDGGFGGAPGFASDALDTAWVLLALRAAKSDPGGVIGSATNYLLLAQAADGGYGVRGNGSNPYLTGLAALALQSDSNSPAVLDALNRANGWLLSQQRADGSWGGVAETSAVYLALLGSTSDPGMRDRVTVFLASQQQPDGSWGGDPFSTALALRAWMAQPRPVPTTGNVVLRVVDGLFGQAIAGASAAIQGVPGASALSDADGKIVFSNVTAGSYALNVGAPGYASQSISFTLRAGTTLDLGVARLASAPTTGILEGIVKDASTGTALAGAAISVTGSATATILTAADGSYRLTGLTPGAVTVAAGKSGYLSVGGTGTIMAGSTLLFSPALQPEGQPPVTDGAISGRIVDAASRVPLSGVAVAIGTSGKGAVSGADGRFSVSGLPAGTYPVDFELAGYVPQALPGVLVAAGSTTDVQEVGLYKAVSAVALAGKVTDLGSGQPIAGAMVSVLGTAIGATTDGAGNYRIEGMTPGTVTMRFSAIGYTSETVIRSFEAPGEFNVDFALRAGQGSSLALSALATDLSHYGAYTPVSINIEAHNSGAQAAAGTVAVMIVDPDGKVLESLQASWTDANGVAQRKFDFPPGASTGITVPWNTQWHAPGRYTLVAKIYQGSDDPASGGLVEIAERQSGFTIDPTQAIQSVTLTPLPAYTVLGATEQVGFRLDIVNRSNVPVTSELSYQLLAPDSSVLRSGAASVTLQAQEGTKSVLIDGAAVNFAASGLCQSNVASTSGPVPAHLEAKAIAVAPGTRIEPSQSLLPKTVTPDGDKRIRIDIRLQGVEQK